jgi:dienelactone hydrolase
MLASNGRFGEIPWMRMLVAGVVLVLALSGCGRSDSSNGSQSTTRNDSELVPANAAIKPPLGPPLHERRAAFATSLSKDIPELERDELVEPPRGMYEAVRYNSAIGPLRAYVTPDPRDGKKHPAVLDCHGGFGGVGAWLWDPPDYTRPFRDAGLTFMSPSWRGENDNPGHYEMFWGEVDDALAALRYLRSLPYVDPGRIYIIGHSTGGTLAMLLATETDQVRAVFSFEGAPNIAQWIRIGGGPGFVPFNMSDSREFALRSVVAMASSFRVPTSWFYAPRGAFANDAKPFQAALTATNNQRVHLLSVRGADHLTVLTRLVSFVAMKIVADRDLGNPFPPLDDAEVQRAFDAAP